MFSRLFGGGKKDAPAKPPTPPPAPKAVHPPPGGAAHGAAHAVTKVDDTLEAMELREALLTKKIDNEVAKAKQAMEKGNRNQALLCMKRKKMYEDQLAKMGGHRVNMETMKMTIEESAITAQVLEAQRAAGAEMARLNAQMEADKVEDDMDKIRDEMDKQREIAEMLGQPLAADPVDDDELMDELDALVAADKPAVKAPAAKAPVEKLPDLGPKVPNRPLPASPVAEKAAVEDDEEAALRALEAELAA